MADSSKVEQVQKKIGKTVTKTSEEVQEKVEQKYDVIIDKLKDERDWLEKELKHEYRNARRYVRANPERGLGLAIVAGVLVGIFLGRATK